MPTSPQLIMIAKDYEAENSSSDNPVLNMIAGMTKKYGFLSAMVPAGSTIQTDYFNFPYYTKTEWPEYQYRIKQLYVNLKTIESELKHMAMVIGLSVTSVDYIDINSSRQAAGHLELPEPVRYKNSPGPNDLYHGDVKPIIDRAMDEIRKGKVINLNTPIMKYDEINI